MGIWNEIATWRGPTPNKGGAMREQRGLVVHIAEGTYEGTIAWQRNDSSNVSSHFIVALDGRIAQMVDTDVTAWTQSAGNGKWLSVENAGFTPNPLTPQQVEANARLFARGHLVYGYPLQIAVNPDGRGLGHHSMGCNWPAGAWGHCDCPGPAIIAQKDAILRRAIEIVNGDLMDQTEPLIKPTGANRSVGDMYADVQNLRNAFIGDGAVVLGPDGNPIPGYPRAGSPLDNMARMPQLLAQHASAPIDPEALAAIMKPMLDAMEARLNARIDAARADARDAVADLGEGGAVKVREDKD